MTINSNLLLPTWNIKIATGRNNLASTVDLSPMRVIKPTTVRHFMKYVTPQNPPLCLSNPCYTPIQMRTEIGEQKLGRTSCILSTLFVLVGAWSISPRFERFLHHSETSYQRSNTCYSPALTGSGFTQGVFLAIISLVASASLVTGNRRMTIHSGVPLLKVVGMSLLSVLLIILGHHFRAGLVHLPQCFRRG